MSVTVANYGDAPARGVTVQLEQDGDALPALVLDDIPAREEITHKFRVQFAGIGGHSLTASLPADAVDIDNRRYFACDLPAARPVLIIDGSPGRPRRTSAFARPRSGRQHAHRLAAARRAGQLSLADRERLKQASGRVPARCAATRGRRADGARRIRAERRRRRVLRRRRTPTAAFTTIDSTATARACSPCRSSCPRSSRTAKAKRRRRGSVTQHPLFQVLAGTTQRFSAARDGRLLLRAAKTIGAADRWHRARSSPGCATTQPLVVEKKFGKGRVVAQLTKLSSGDTPLGRWSNWSLNPAFPVLANELVSYLARRTRSIRCDGRRRTYRVAEEGKYEPVSASCSRRSRADDARSGLKAVPRTYLARRSRSMPRPRTVGSPRNSKTSPQAASTKCNSAAEGHSSTAISPSTRPRRRRLG